MGTEDEKYGVDGMDAFRNFSALELDTVWIVDCGLWMHSHYKASLWAINVIRVVSQR